MLSVLLLVRLLLLLNPQYLLWWTRVRDAIVLAGASSVASTPVSVLYAPHITPFAAEFVAPASIYLSEWDPASSGGGGTGTVNGTEAVGAQCINISSPLRMYYTLDGTDPCVPMPTAGIDSGFVAGLGNVTLSAAAPFTSTPSWCTSGASVRPTPISPPPSPSTTSSTRGSSASSTYSMPPNMHLHLATSGVYRLSVLAARVTCGMEAGDAADPALGSGGGGSGSGSGSGSRAPTAFPTAHVTSGNTNNSQSDPPSPLPSPAPSLTPTAAPTYAPQPPRCHCTLQRSPIASRDILVLGRSSPSPQVTAAVIARHGDGDGVIAPVPVAAGAAFSQGLLQVTVACPNNSTTGSAGATTTVAMFRNTANSSVATAPVRAAFGGVELMEVPLVRVLQYTVTVTEGKKGDPVVTTHTRICSTGGSTSTGKGSVPATIVSLDAHRPATVSVSATVDTRTDPTGALQQYHRLHPIPPTQAEEDADHNATAALLLLLPPLYDSTMKDAQRREYFQQQQALRGQFCDGLRASVGFGGSGGALPPAEVQSLLDQYCSSPAVDAVVQVYASVMTDAPAPAPVTCPCPTPSSSGSGSSCACTVDTLFNAYPSLPAGGGSYYYQLSDAEEYPVCTSCRSDVSANSTRNPTNYTSSTQKMPLALSVRPDLRVFVVEKGGLKAPRGYSCSDRTVRGRMLVLHNPLGHFDFLPPRKGCARMEKNHSKKEHVANRTGTSRGTEFEYDFVGTLPSETGRAFRPSYSEHSSLHSLLFAGKTSGVGAPTSGTAAAAATGSATTSSSSSSSTRVQRGSTTNHAAVKRWEIRYAAERAAGLGGAGGCAAVTNAGFFNITTGECLGHLVSGNRVVQALPKGHPHHSVSFGIRGGRFVTGFVSEAEVVGDNGVNGSLSPFDTLVSGLGWLVRDGQTYIADSLFNEHAAVGGEEDVSEFQGTGSATVFAEVLSARTAVGHDKQGRLVLLQVEGRTWESGMSLYEFSDFASELGMYNAINLDGGGSATMSVDGVLVSEPSWKCVSLGDAEAEARQNPVRRLQKDDHEGGYSHSDINHTPHAQSSLLEYVTGNLLASRPEGRGNVRRTAEIDAAGVMFDPSHPASADGDDTGQFVNTASATHSSSFFNTSAASMSVDVAGGGGVVVVNGANQLYCEKEVSSVACFHAMPPPPRNLLQGDDADDAISFNLSDKSSVVTDFEHRTSSNYNADSDIDPPTSDEVSTVTSVDFISAQMHRLRHLEEEVAKQQQQMALLATDGEVQRQRQEVRLWWAVLGAVLSAIAMTVVAWGIKGLCDRVRVRRRSSANGGHLDGAFDEDLSDDEDDDGDVVALVGIHTPSHAPGRVTSDSTIPPTSGMLRNALSSSKQRSKQQQYSRVGQNEENDTEEDRTAVTPLHSAIV